MKQIVWIGENESVVDVFFELYAQNEETRFIFVFDEWDFIFNQNFTTEKDKKDYLMFLRDLLKDRPYVQLAYMTGILPIAKYSSGSELKLMDKFTEMLPKEPSLGYVYRLARESERMLNATLAGDTNTMEHSCKVEIL